MRKTWTTSQGGRPPGTPLQATACRSPVPTMVVVMITKWSWWSRRGHAQWNSKSRGPEVRGQVESTHGLQINWSDFIMSSVIQRVPAYAAIAAYILVHCKYTAFWYIVCKERVPLPPYHNHYCFPTLHVQGSYLSFREASYGKPHEHACNA